MLQRIFGYCVVLSIISCSFSQKMKDGEMAYERKQFAVAVNLLEEEYTQKKNTEVHKGRKAWLLGQSYMKLLEYEDAKEWFNKAINHGYGVEALSSYARVSKILEDYEQAIDAYQKIGNISGRKQETDRDVLLCKQAIEYKNRPQEYSIERIFENSSVADYSPVIFDGQYLVFTSERKDVTGKDVYKWTGERFSDVFIMLKSGSEVRRFDSAINTALNEGTPWFTKDMQTIYFTRCYNAGNGDDFCKLMVSNRASGLWTDPEILPFVQDKINYGQPTLIENDSVLVFAADIEQPGGSTDLYYSELVGDGTWSEPEKLPSVINSQGNEKFPTGDSDTLYFSSDFLPGMGGYDIFKTFLRKDGTWSIPINMGHPINSGGDDFSFVVDYSARPKANVSLQGYFSSSRRGSGKDDIYRFSKIVIPKETTPIKVDEGKRTLFVTVKTYTSIFATEDDPNSGVIGRMPLGETFVKIISDTSNEKIAEAYADKNGFYYSEIPMEVDVKVIGAKLGYLNASTILLAENMTFVEGEKTKTINVELNLEKIYTDKEITLNNIYYDYDKWEIKKEARPTLDLLVKLLTDNPQIKIQLSSHTDCRGEDLYNLELSQKRAQSAIEYLMSKGILAERLVAQGYGETQLLDNCSCEQCSEEQHQKNRRTTFKILKKD
ncbi:MAG: OmpA family protein [Saprospiraceae bacterium]|nr:OmpA family protein [Saprospiraceae bacterium]